MRRYFFPLSLSMLVAVPAQADALLDQALSNGGGYDSTQWARVSIMQVWAGGSTVVGDAIDRTRTGQRARPRLRDEKIVRYDPSLPPGKRQTVEYLKDSKQVHVRADEDDLPDYDEMRQLIHGRPERVTETSGTVTYRFSVDPKQVRKIGGAEIDIGGEAPLPLLAGRAIVQKTGRGAPYIKTMVVMLPTNGKGRGNAAGKVRRLSFGLRFAPEPRRGVKLLQAFGMDSSLQGLGLVTVDLSVLNRISAYRYVGK